MCDLFKVIEPAALPSIEQISPLQVALGSDQIQATTGDGLDVAMQYLEFGSHIANIVMAIAVVYGAFSVKSWLRQLVLGRRADVAIEVLGELEYFYIRLEQLVGWQYMLDWSEWGRTFNDILREHFLPAKLKAQRLKNEKINQLLESMEKLSTELPGNQRLTTQLTPQGELFWPKEASSAKDKFQTAWKQFQICWANLKDKLSQEALYDMPSKRFRHLP